jgi:DNA-binding transcriptional LysR family regulator
MTSFSNYDLVIQAAIDGQGIALGWLGLVTPLIAKGDLVVVTEDIVRSNCCYKISYRNSSSRNGPKQVFEWLVNELEKNQ